MGSSASVFDGLDMVFAARIDGFDIYDGPDPNPNPAKDQDEEGGQGSAGESGAGAGVDAGAGAGAGARDQKEKSSSGIYSKRTSKAPSALESRYGADAIFSNEKHGHLDASQLRSLAERVP